MDSSEYFFKVPQEIFLKDRFKRLKPTSKVVYVTMCHLSNIYANPDGWFYHSLLGLADKGGLNRRTVMRATKELKGNDLIEVKRFKYTGKDSTSPNSYRIIGFTFKKEKPEGAEW